MKQQGSDRANDQSTGGRINPFSNTRDPVGLPIALERSMFVRTRDAADSLSEPPWASVAAAIEALDGEAQDEVSLVR